MNNRLIIWYNNLTAHAQAVVLLSALTFLLMVAACVALACWSNSKEVKILEETGSEILEKDLGIDIEKIKRISDECQSGECQY